MTLPKKLLFAPPDALGMVVGPFGSVTIPIVLNNNAKFTRGSYIFALSFGEDGGRLPPLGLTSVSVYVNFE